MPDIDYTLLAQFMMLFLTIKRKNTHRFDKSILYKAHQTLDCVRKYSKDKFEKVQKFREFRLLILKIYNSDMEELFSEAKTMGVSRDRYIEAIDDIIDNHS